MEKRFLRNLGLATVLSSATVEPGCTQLTEEGQEVVVAPVDDTGNPNPDDTGVDTDTDTDTQDTDTDTDSGRDTSDTADTSTPDTSDTADSGGETGDTTDSGTETGVEAEGCQGHIGLKTISLPGEVTQQVKDIGWNEIDSELGGSKDRVSCKDGDNGLELSISAPSPEAYTAGATEAEGVMTAIMTWYKENTVFIDDDGNEWNINLNGVAPDEAAASVHGWLVADDGVTEWGNPTGTTEE